jgi:hypothetical protein
VLVFKRFASLLEATDSERTPIVQNLTQLLHDPQRRYYAIATLRRGQSVELPKLGSLEKPLRDGHVLMAFTTAELRYLIEDPAKGIGLIFEPGLIDQILIEIQGESTALPLLRFTLQRLWDRRERNRITWSAYRQTGAGRTALRVAMDEMYGRLTSDQQAALRQILLAMVDLEPNGSFTACDVLREDLYRICGDRGRVDAVLEELQREELVRLITKEEHTTVALSYSALLTSWPPLVVWLDEFRIKERFRLRLKQAAALWQERQEPGDLLWQGAMLMEADREFATDSSLTTPERDFLRAGQRREAKTLAKRQLIIIALGLAAVGIISALSFAVVAGKNAARFARRDAAIASYNSEKDTRMYTSGIDSLVRGDLPATLLWLNERNRFPIGHR